MNTVRTAVNCIVDRAINPSPHCTHCTQGAMNRQLNGAHSDAKHRALLEQVAILETHQTVKSDYQDHFEVILDF